MTMYIICTIYIYVNNHYMIYDIYVGDPKRDVNAVEDFLEVVLAAYITTAAATVMEMDPSMLLDTKGRYERPIPSVGHIAQVICREYSNLQRLIADIPPSDDKVLEHTKDLLTIVLIWHHYCDITREGDGDRLLQLMPVLLRLFKDSGRKNYAAETCLVQLQYHYLMSQRMQTQLLYSRFINTHGIKGKNIPCDLHMEHLNRYFK